ncbi:ANM_HP_G0103800.mRNA.1.CDS.1 [Saccharomyces cerevisiae]|nr:ANM_HP_G0103800.mRNA.1.CDS.1 [Saccharomyces cerevisiae]CAI6424936.1 ANM_HP_G0103800.mRNA.1.CDS.1 [Saccharomyces cerevisiae]
MTLLLHFSKMFTRKNEPTLAGPRVPSLTTIAQTIQQSNIKVNKLPTQRTTSVGSLSSMSNRYSPIRVASQEEQDPQLVGLPFIDYQRP